MVQTKQEAPYGLLFCFRAVCGAPTIAYYGDKKKRLPEGNLFCYASGTA